MYPTCPTNKHHGPWEPHIYAPMKRPEALSKGIRGSATNSSLDTTCSPQKLTYAHTVSVVRRAGMDDDREQCERVRAARCAALQRHSPAVAGRRAEERRGGRPSPHRRCETPELSSGSPAAAARSAAQAAKVGCLEGVISHSLVHGVREVKVLPD